MAFDQVKMINKLRKAQSELKKEIIEVEAGDADLGRPRQIGRRSGLQHQVVHLCQHQPSVPW